MSAIERPNAELSAPLSVGLGAALGRTQLLLPQAGAHRTD